MLQSKMTSVGRDADLVSALPDADLISALPDPLLHHILGFLQAPEVVQMCMIAWRWRHLWKSMPVLRITGAGPVQSLRNFLDQLLLLRDSLSLEMCLFDFDRYYAVDVPYVNRWIQHALLCQVWVLSVTVFAGYGIVKELRLDNLPVISQYLTKLKLSGLILYEKFLDFSSCGLLKDLNMTECCISADKISSQSLKQLSIQKCKFLLDSRTHITAPSLISLHVNEPLGKTALLEDMPVLVRATVRLDIACHDSS